MERNVKFVIAIGRVHRYLDEGKSVSEMAEIMKLPEATIRSYVNIVEEAKTYITENFG